MAQSAAQPTAPYAASQASISPPYHHHLSHSLHPPRITLRLSPHCRDYSPHICITTLPPLLRTVGLLTALPPTHEQLQHLVCTKFNFPLHFATCIRLSLHGDAEIDALDYHGLVRDGDVVYVGIDEQELKHVVEDYSAIARLAPSTAIQLTATTTSAQNGATSSQQSASSTAASPQQTAPAAPPTPQPQTRPAPQQIADNDSRTSNNNKQSATAQVNIAGTSSPSTATATPRRQAAPTTPTNGTPELLSPTIRRCSTPGCGKTAQFGPCPECGRLGKGNRYFCSQECFERNFATHAELHHGPEKQQKK